MFYLNTALIVGAVGIVLLCLTLFLECTSARFSNGNDRISKIKKSTDNLQQQKKDCGKDRALSEAVESPRVTVLVPAYNEALVIRSTVENLLPQLQDKDDLVIVADNCSDSTAEIARQAGATVIVRKDIENRGKGYALDYGIQSQQENPPDVVVVVDADCWVEPQTIERIAQAAIATDRPVQATYLMEKPEPPSPKDAISAFAFKVKNFVRPKGLANLEQPCLLMGTGMAFPWSIIDKVNWATSSIVEDMQLGLDLAIAGHPPQFCPEARVNGRLPQQQAAIKSQRTRWEHGHIQTLLTYVPQLLKAAIAQKRFNLLILALDLSIPPLSLLVMLVLGFVGIAFLAAILGASWVPLLFGIIAASLLLVAIVAAWAEYGRSDLPLTQLLSVPLYLLWKIPLYFKFLRKPQLEWVRTARKQADVSE